MRRRSFRGRRSFSRGRRVFRGRRSRTFGRRAIKIGYRM